MIPDPVDPERPAADGLQSGREDAAVEKYEYFSGTPEIGIVPRAPHAGPLLRHVFEQEHGTGSKTSTGIDHP